ncbi:MAG: hypothetical protein E7672_07915 [Ruminococcaceae bacterium]|nr:hypothetical protein [Oscillospiraceae bacterium]
MTQPKFSGGIILNIDTNSVTEPFLNRAIEEENFTEATLYPFIDQYADTEVKAVAINTFGQSSVTPTKVWTDVLSKSQYKTENGLPVDYSNRWPGLQKIVNEYGIDPHAVWFKRCRERGMEAWMSLRMNDCHCPREKVEYGRSDFFYEAQRNGWMIGILPGHGLHYHNAYDYAVPKVRQMMLDYIEEQLGMYDVDALELDFSREMLCFKYPTCTDKCEIMNDFIRNVKKITDAAGEKYGHKIKIAVLLFRDIDQCKTFGFDAETWDRENLVDYIVPKSRYFSCDNDMPIDVWKKRCPNTLIGAGIEMNFYTPHNKTDISFRPKHAVKVNDDMANGMAAAYVSEGADVIYLYNHFISPYFSPDSTWLKNTHSEIRRIGEADTIYSTRRRHIIMFQEQETVPAGYEAFHPLPVEISSGQTKEISLPIGYVPNGKKARLLIGFSYGKPSDAEIIVNGKLCSTFIQCDDETIAYFAERDGNPIVHSDTTLYIGDIDADSLMRYNLSITGKEDVVIEYIEVNID